MLPKSPSICRLSLCHTMDIDTLRLGLGDSEETRKTHVRGHHGCRHRARAHAHLLPRTPPGAAIGPGARPPGPLAVLPAGSPLCGDLDWISNLARDLARRQRRHHPIQTLQPPRCSRLGVHLVHPRLEHLGGCERIFDPLWGKVLDVHSGDISRATPEMDVNWAHRVHPTHCAIP